MSAQIPSIMQPIAQCKGCGGMLFANVFHLCASNQHLYTELPQDKRDELIRTSYVPAPPAPSTSEVQTFPPDVSVKTGRTHCEACKEALHPNVMHKCHGNQEYQVAVISFTEITEACPDCKAKAGKLVSRVMPRTYVVVCHYCRTFLGPEVFTSADAIYTWNAMAQTAAPKSGFPKWLFDLDDKKWTPVMDPTPRPEHYKAHPNLENYKGVCPACNGKKPEPESEEKPCKVCGGAGELK